MEGFQDFLVEGGAGVKGHEGDKEGFVKATGFGCSATEDGFDGREEASASETEEEGGISGVVVIEAWLGGDGVEEV